MRIGIVGCGVVGGALREALKDKHEIFTVDPALGLNYNLEYIDVGFICVPAATRKNHSQDLSVIEEGIDRCPNVPIFVRSSVLPGTCDMLSSVFEKKIIAMPEFLTERTAAEDMARLPILVGHDGAKIIKELFPAKHVLNFTNSECEMAKYFNNVNGAVQVNMFNVFKQLCETMKIDYDEVMKATDVTGYIDTRYSEVPGPDGKYGFGGKCFPKDLLAFCNMTKYSQMLMGVVKDNKFFRRKDAN